MPLGTSLQPLQAVECKAIECKMKVKSVRTLALSGSTAAGAVCNCCRYRHQADDGRFSAKRPASVIRRRVLHQGDPELNQAALPATGRPISKTISFAILPSRISKM